MMKTRFLMLLLIALFSVSVRAELTIEIMGGAANQIPIAVVPFDASPVAGAQQNSISNIINADLKRSGLFRTLETRGVANQPHQVSDVKYSDWLGIQAQALTIGSIEPLPGNRMKVAFRLLDVLKQNQLLAMEFIITQSQQRMTAHKIADMIYEKLTGEKGVFATRISYVNKANGRYSLEVADADGFNPQTVVSSKEPLISPSWSPDGTKIAYVSFEKKKPVIYVQSLVSGQRYVLANFKGNNSAPAWSPDGRSWLATLTRDGGSQLYQIDVASGDARRLTQSLGIDTEPSFTQDGARIYFVSDRGGSPQIYRMAATGGSVERVTFGGSYNISPALSPDGRWLSYITRIGGQFKVQVMNLSTGQSSAITETSADERPSFAPNSKLIVYATVLQGREALMTTTLDGKIKAKLSGQSGDIREPAWGPYR
jgi:TolB protein